MNKIQNIQKMQTRIDEIQAKYGQWCVLAEQLEADIQRFQESIKIMKELEKFMTEEFLEYYEAIESGANINLNYSNNSNQYGKYSVMSEDTLWNAYADFQRLAWARLRLATEALDPSH